MHPIQALAYIVRWWAVQRVSDFGFDLLHLLQTSLHEHSFIHVTLEQGVPSLVDGKELKILKIIKVHY